MDEPKIVIEDEQHLRAHTDDMFLGREEVLDIIRKELKNESRIGEVKRAVECGKKVGLTGLRRLAPEEKSSFWMPRKGRTIPSHLIYGKKKPTEKLTFWGHWRGEKTFVLQTFYPGEPAPREPFDPKISLEELKESVLFWAKHAIVVEH
jgi:hypothetical protein